MLLDVVRDLPSEPFRIEHVVDRRRRYQLSLDPRFPLAVHLYSFSTSNNPLRFNWHERLELWVSVAGGGRFRMGDRTLEFARGDVIVVDNLNLHGVVDCRGPLCTGVVITFMPELICGPGSYPCDSVYLTPFYWRTPEVDPVLRAADKLSGRVHSALGRMVECHLAGSALGHARQAGCKVYLLEALYHLAQHFRLPEASVLDFHGLRRESLQFGRLYEHLLENFAEPITVSAAASMVGMSEFRFMQFFKKATGMTFVKYLTHLRLAHAHRLLTATDLSISEIAVSVGFSDQSYFDRRFRQHYGETPRKVRESAVLSQ